MMSIIIKLTALTVLLCSSCVSVTWSRGMDFHPRPMAHPQMPQRMPSTPPMMQNMPQVGNIPQANNDFRFEFQGKHGGGFISREHQFYNPYYYPYVYSYPNQSYQSAPSAPVPEQVAPEPEVQVEPPHVVEPKIIRISPEGNITTITEPKKDEEPKPDEYKKQERANSSSIYEQSK